MKSKTLKLLLVDDDEDEFELTRAMLTQARPGRFSLDWADSYESGQTALDADHYDAALVDYDLGMRTGIQLIREAVAKGHSTPIILFTGRGSFDVDVEAMQAGASLYLTKAEANPLLLERAIRYAIERKQSEEQLRAVNASLTLVNQTLHDELDRRKKAEAALNVTAKRLQAIFDSSPVSIWEEDFSAVNRYFQALRIDGVRDFAAYFDAHPDAVVECANMVRIIDVNHTSMDYFNVSTREELIINLPRFFCEDSYPIFKNEMITLATGGTKFDCEIPICRDNNERRILELHLSVVSGYEDTLERVLVSFFDITDRKRTEAALRDLTESLRTDGAEGAGGAVGPAIPASNIATQESTENALRRYELLSDSSRDMILFIRLDDGRILEANSSAESAYGYTRAELREMTIHALRAPSTLPLTPLQMAHANAESILFETVHRRKDGRHFPVEVSSQGASLGGERILISIIRDITERKRIETALRATEERFNKAFYASPTALAISRQTDGLFIDVNESFERLTGYQRAEVIGKTSLELKVYVNPTSRQKMIEKLHKDRFVRDYEQDMQRKNGEVRQCLFSVEMLEIGGEAHMLTSILDITERKLIEAQINDLARFPSENPSPVLRVTAGGVIAYANATSKDLLQTWERRVGEDVPEYIGALIRACLEQDTIQYHEQRVDRKTLIITFAPSIEDNYVNVYGADITQQKKAEEAATKTAEELARSNQELEQFAYIASHDLQEPLRKIETLGDQLLTKTTHLDEQAQGYLQRIRLAATRMRRLIDDLLALSRVSTAGHPFEAVPLEEIAADVISDLELRIRSTGGRVELGKLPTIEGDPFQLRQLLINLIGNSLKYHRSGVPPVVKLKSRRLPGNAIQVEVSDNGIGFDEQYAELIFQPFQRLVGTSEYEGTGIGLAICRKIVERHGGKITARSRPGSGATFLITLPIQQVKSDFSR